MDAVDAVDHSASPKDEDYEYNLVGVLVHAGVTITNSTRGIITLID
jgi:hypothetical protein